MSKEQLQAKLAALTKELWWEQLGPDNMAHNLKAISDRGPWSWKLCRYTMVERRDRLLIERDIRVKVLREEISRTREALAQY